MTTHMRARERLRERLQQLRKATDQTGAAFAEPLGWKQAKISKIETGRQLPSETDVRKWAQATGADADELLRLLEQARGEFAALKNLYAAAGGADKLQDTIATQEGTADRLAKFQPATILGVLQTADYAREMLRLVFGPNRSADIPEDEISRMIAARLRRQAVIHEPGRDITLLMSEGALRTRVASPATMRDQLEHLARLAETLTTATLGIIPFSAQMPIVTMSGYAIYDDLVTIETLGGDLEIADPVEVARYYHYTKLLLDVALTGVDAARLCRQVANEIASEEPES